MCTSNVLKLTCSQLKAFHHHLKYVELTFESVFQNPNNKYQSNAVAMTRSHSLLPVLPRREVEHPFRGLLASQLECLDCQYRHPVRYDLFDSLSLSFPKQAWVSVVYEMSLVARKSVFRVSIQVQYKSDCTATEDG